MPEYNSKGHEIVYKINRKQGFLYCVDSNGDILEFELKRNGRPKKNAK